MDRREKEYRKCGLLYSLPGYHACNERSVRPDIPMTIIDELKPFNRCEELGHEWSPVEGRCVLCGTTHLEELYRIKMGCPAGSNDPVPIYGEGLKSERAMELEAMQIAVNKTIGKIKSTPFNLICTCPTLLNGHHSGCPMGEK